MYSEKEFLRSLSQIANAFKQVYDDEVVNSFFKEGKTIIFVQEEKEKVDWINNFMSKFTQTTGDITEPDKVSVRMGDLEFVFTSQGREKQT